MANATAGSAGNPPITLYAGIGDPTEPQSMRLFPLQDFPLQDLDGPAGERLRQAILEDPVFSKLLDNFGSGDAAAAVSTESSSDHETEISLNNLETNPTTNGANTQDRAETDPPRKKNTKTNNAGKSAKNGRNKPRNGSKKASDTSPQTASPTGVARPAKAKTPAKERKSASHKSTKPGGGKSSRCRHPLYYRPPPYRTAEPDIFTQCSKNHVLQRPGIRRAETVVQPRMALRKTRLVLQPTGSTYEPRKTGATSLHEVRRLHPLRACPEGASVRTRRAGSSADHHGIQGAKSQ